MAVYEAEIFAQLALCQAELSTAIEVQIPLICEEHSSYCASFHNKPCECELPMNEVVVIKEIARNESIQSRAIQLHVRRRDNDDFDSSKLEVTDAYFVASDEAMGRVLNEKLESIHPEIKLYNIEALVSSSRCARPDVSSSRDEIPAVMNKNQINSLCAVHENHKNDRHIQKNRKTIQLQGRNNSPICSKNLKNLDSICETKILLNRNGSSSKNLPSNSSSYYNQCYMITDTSFTENLNRHQDEAIELSDIVSSAKRISDHLEMNEGLEEESKLIRNYFNQELVHYAIEATARHKINSTYAEMSGITAVVEKMNNLKIVRIKKYDGSYLGATVRNDGERVIVGRTVEGGIVTNSKLFYAGDEILMIDDLELRGKNVNEVRNILHSKTDEVCLTIIPKDLNDSQSATAEKAWPIGFHFRALFDYDPKDDLYVPCREIALKFHKRHVFQVLSASDENWWQVYRNEGDASTSLAGIIPSQKFRERVALQTHRKKNESDIKRKELFTCSRKRSMKAAARDSNVDVISADEITSDHNPEILAYEEVSLYVGSTNIKRPIILCGPEGVGCLELRQRLAETNTEKYASAVPHTTRPKKNGEVDGVHYHFVTRQKFQDNAKSAKFIEYGAYLKHFYGTSVSSINAVIDQGKICLLTLKAENLKALRRTTLMPYVIFVAPPPLDQFKEQMRAAGRPHINDDQLALIINEGKMLEQQYGHLFDRIMVNTDLKRSLKELLVLVDKLESEPQWVPSIWLSSLC